MSDYTPEQKAGAWLAAESMAGNEFARTALNMLASTQQGEAAYEKDKTAGAHKIESENVLLCSETGRVVAVFYNEYDLDNFLERSHTRTQQQGEAVATVTEQGFTTTLANLRLPVGTKLYTHPPADKGSFYIDFFCSEHGADREACDCFSPADQATVRVPVELTTKMAETFWEGCAAEVDTPTANMGGPYQSSAKGGVMKLLSEVKLTPEQIAEGLWELDADEQADMLNHLFNIAGGSHPLTMQFLYCREACEKRQDRSLEAFQYMFASAFKHMW